MAVHVGPSDFDDSLETRTDRELTSGGQEKITFLNRLSLIHMFLLTFSKGGTEIDYLGIQPYLSIPLSLIPRFLYPDKPFSHAGTYMLNIHYGLQTEDQVLQTTIGWGMLAEAWAAGGLVGIVVLAIFLGGLLGEIGRLSLFVPMFSFRTFIGLTFMGVVIHTELTMGVLTTVLFQSLLILLGVSLVFMRTFRRDDYARL